jgi:Bacterial Ig-like domain
MRRSLVLLVLSVVVAASGCAKKTTAPVTDGGGGVTPIGSGAGLVATNPSPRATAALYDSDIWGQFDRALDGRTVSTQSVYFKLDGQRLPCTVSYDGITRRILVVPSATLALQRTYTVEFSPAVKTFDGQPLPEGLYFQFTTNSLRRVAYDFPGEDALEGPLAGFGWSGTLGAQNNLLHEVYASEDSAAVAVRSSAVLQRQVFTRYLPRDTWRPGSRVYWAVTTENRTTLERMNGPVRSFRVMGPEVRTDSIVVSPVEVGAVVLNGRFTVSMCDSQWTPTGPNNNAAMHWNLTALPADARIVGVRARFWALDRFARQFDQSRPELWQTQNDWNGCTVLFPGPPYPETDGLLASGVTVDSTEVNFTAPRFGAMIEMLARRRGFMSGPLFKTAISSGFHAPRSLEPRPVRPVMVIRYQRVPPAAQP